MLRNIIYRLGSNPKRSLRFFMAGIALFLLALGLIAIGYYHSHWFQIAGLALLVVALVVSAYGYLGIFSNRFAQFLKQGDNHQSSD